MKAKRQIVLDTETTGLNPKLGNRIIEIGCVELIDRKLTGNNFHRYINPKRESEEGALAVHGLTTEFLKDKPTFDAIGHELLAYLQDSEIIIHNAPFDLGFLEAEYARLQVPSFKETIGNVIDTLVQAKELYPGKRNSLDALCDRYEISNAHRTLHGALLDAELLAEVFLAMSRGQEGFFIDAEIEAEVVVVQEVLDEPMPLVLVEIAEDISVRAHDDLLVILGKEIKGQSIWMKNIG